MEITFMTTLKSNYHYRSKKNKQHIFYSFVFGGGDRKKVVNA